MSDAETESLEFEIEIGIGIGGEGDRWCRGVKGGVAVGKTAVAAIPIGY